jgi:uncharacterized protein (UPF0264 family)
MVQLLVSVRSAEEAKSAFAGGADIIDAKEPSRGSLGAVSRATLAEIAASVPAGCPFSVALGDVTTVEEVRIALNGLDPGPRSGSVYLKIGFAGVGSPDRIQMLIDSAAELAGTASTGWQLVPVAYADAERAGTIAPATLVQLVAGTQVAGVLLDTHLKDGRRLLDWFDPSALRTWVGAARAADLLVGLAGSLEPGDFEVIQESGADVWGVRGAACDGGRDGRISVLRVSSLRRALDRASYRVGIGRSS